MRRGHLISQQKKIKTRLNYCAYGFYAERPAEALIQIFIKIYLFEMINFCN